MSLRLNISVPQSVVPDGVVFHRLLVRKLGPLLAVAIALGVGLLSAVLLLGSSSAVRGIPGFLLAIIAMPTLPLFGVPVMGGMTRWLLAISTSAALWACVGHIAAQRSTRRVVSSWPEWRREWTRLCIGIWAGSMVGLGVAAMVLGINPLSI